MTTKQLAEFHAARPFVPFYICMADGRKYLVDRPEMLGYVPGTKTCTVWMPEAEAFRLLDLLLMTSLEPAAKKTRKPRRKAG